MAYIVSAASAFPEHYYPQAVLGNAIKKYCLAMELDFDLETIERFFTNVQIDGRYFMLPLDSFFEPPTMATSVQGAIEASLELVEKAVKNLLEQADLEAQDISLLASVSLLPVIPALDVRLMNRLPFASHLKRMPLGGIGCLGGAFGIARVADYLLGHPEEAAILFCVDAASLLWQGSLQNSLSSLIARLAGEPTLYSQVIMTMITAALFGDGAAAVLMVGANHPLAHSAKLEVIDSRSQLVPDTLDLMGTQINESGFQEILQPEVGEIAGKVLRKALDPLLAQHKISLERLSHWFVHPGGPKILTAIQESCRLSDDALWVSKKVLKEVGNLSSPTVLCVLQKALQLSPPPINSYSLIVGMGPGFAQEIVLTRSSQS